MKYDHILTEEEYENLTANEKAYVKLKHPEYVPNKYLKKRVYKKISKKLIEEYNLENYTPEQQRYLINKVLIEKPDKTELSIRKYTHYKDRTEPFTLEEWKSKKSNSQAYFKNYYPHLVPKNFVEQFINTKPNGSTELIETSDDSIHINNNNEVKDPLNIT